MSELTIEQKAKLYDEVIERAKKWYNAPNVDKIPTFGNRIIEDIFPELKEPEDEQIRKELIKLLRNLFNNYSYFIKDPFYTECINWLEKQREQSSNILWHDVSEEPDEQREIFCEWKGYADSIWHDVAFYHPSNKTFWNGEDQIENVVKWAYIDEMLNKSNPYSGVSFQYNGHTWGMCARDNGVEISIDNELKAFVSIDKSFIYPISQSYLAPKSASQALQEEKIDNANKVENKSKPNSRNLEEIDWYM